MSGFPESGGDHGRPADRPKLLGEPDALASRLSRVDDVQVAPLNEFVRRLRTRIGPDATIPYFDPWDGGIHADVLFLLEAPGPKARDSGFVSRNNQVFVEVQAYLGG